MSWIEHQRGVQTDLAKTEAPRSWKEHHGSRRVQKGARSRLHTRVPVLRMVGQYGISQEIELSVAKVRGFHRPKQGLSKRQPSLAQDRQTGRLHCWPRPPKLHGRKCRLPPDTNGRARPDSHGLRHSSGSLLLQNDAVRSKKCRGYISMDGQQNQ